MAGMIPPWAVLGASCLFRLVSVRVLRPLFLSLRNIEAFASGAFGERFRVFVKVDESAIGTAPYELPLEGLVGAVYPGFGIDPDSKSAGEQEPAIEGQRRTQGNLDHGAGSTA